MVASCTWRKRPSMMQPLNRTTSDCRTVGLSDCGFVVFRSDRPTVRLSDAVLASIPMANPSLPQPASAAGTPVLRSARASPYAIRDTPDVVSAHNARRARAGTPRRAVITARRGVPALARLALWALTTSGVSRIAYGLARALRSTGVPAALAGWGRLGFAMGMLASTASDSRTVGRSDRKTTKPQSDSPTVRQSDVVLFRGCIMEGLFRHVHDATIRTLAVNGYAVREAAAGGCCGALHAHAGLVDEARALARANVAALGGDGDEAIVVNSAGCGAMLREYGHLLPDEPAAAALAARVRDVTELLAERGPVPGAPLDRRVAYDPPCHLLHAQRVAEAPLAVLGAIPVLRLLTVPDAEQCCGSAGLFTLVQPAMSRAVLAPKLERLRAAAPQVVATGNPGCVVQLGAGLRAAGVRAAL